MGSASSKRMEKKYKDVLSFDDLLKDVQEFEKKLSAMKSEIKEFDTEFDQVRERTQKKIRDF